MRKTVFLIFMLSVVLYITGCKDDKPLTFDSNTSLCAESSEIVTSADSLDKSEIAGSQIASDAHPVVSESNQSQIGVGNVDISKEKAIEIAFDEAQKYQDEYSLIIPDAAVSNYRLELKSNGNSLYYFIVFDNLYLKDSVCKSAIGVDVDATTGSVLKVHQYK